MRQAQSLNKIIKIMRTVNKPTNVGTIELIQSIINAATYFPLYCLGTVLFPIEIGEKKSAIRTIPKIISRKPVKPCRNGKIR
jgi:hypothetical protein